jgi:hypothetical protein
MLYHHHSKTGSTEKPTVRVDYEAQPESAGEILGLLAQAAEIAAKSGLPIEAFTAGAWQAYVNASPGLAEHLEEMQFDAAVEELRKSGRLAKA